MTPEEQTISEILPLSDDKAKIAMIQLYAKQQCMVFAEWIAINEYHYYRDGNEWGVAMQFPYKTYSTEDLYILFLTQTIQ